MSMTQGNGLAGGRPRPNAAWVVILAGVVAALHVGKLSPALPVLRESLNISLLQAGFFLSLVQMAGMTLGVLVGAVADGIGLKRSMIIGLAVLTLASALSGQAKDLSVLLALRAVEGFGFLLVSLPAPGLIRQLVAPQKMSSMLGVWGAYMPAATAIALLAGPLWMTQFGWPSWWWLFAALSALMGLWLWVVVPGPNLEGSSAQSFRFELSGCLQTGGQRESKRSVPWKAAGQGAAAWPGRLTETLTARGPWLVALTFAAYSAQWLAVVGFLPSIYAEAGLSAAWVGPLTALAAAVNISGNMAAGRLLQRGVAPAHLLNGGFSFMALGSFCAFSALTQAQFGWQFLGVLVFSAVGGLIPGTLFSLAVRLSPHERNISTTVGWMQQCSAFGQFAGPPLAAWLAATAGHWQWTWWLTGTACLAGLALSRQITVVLKPQVAKKS